MENTDNNITNNPFKQLESDQPAPAHIKDKVMTSVNFSNMLLDITELFTSNMATSVTGLFKIKELNSNEVKNDSEEGQTDKNEK